MSVESQKKCCQACVSVGIEIDQGRVNGIGMGMIMNGCSMHPRVCVRKQASTFGAVSARMGSNESGEGKLASKWGL